MHRPVGILALTFSIASAIAFDAAAQTTPATPAADQVITVPTTVVTKQGDATVTIADIDAFAQRIPEKERAVFFNNPKRIETTILTLLMQKQLASEARKLGLENDPLVKEQVAIATDEALGRVRMAHFKSEIKVPNLEALAKETYLGNKDKYVTAGQLDVKQVLIKEDKRSDEEAKALADEVEKEARANPDKFDDLIEKYSEDPTKHANGGVIVQAGTNRYAPQFAEAARKLNKPGEIAPVVKSKYGYHVMQLIRHTQDQPKTFAQVHDEIVKQLTDDYIEKQTKDHTDQLRNQPLDANPDVVASLRTRYGSVEAPPMSEMNPLEPSAKR